MCDIDDSLLSVSHKLQFREVERKAGEGHQGRRRFQAGSEVIASGLICRAVTR